jgi:putative ATP-dependent endonuclease of OLD family
MKIVRVSISNFRSVATSVLHFEGTTVLLGDNNVGKSTVFEAIELAIGPDRISRSQAIDEHDFHGGRYLDDQGEPVPISVEVVVTSLSERQQSKFRSNLEFWRVSDKTLLGPGQISATTGPGVEAAVRVRFVGAFDPDNDEFVTKTWFGTPSSPEGELLSECRSSDKREFGFLHLRALRTGTRALSMERGSLLDVILRTFEVRAQMWERLLDQLRNLDVVGDRDAEFGVILTAIRDAMREIVPGEWGDAPHLRVSELTREDLRRVLKSFLATGVAGYAAPFQHQGSGTINTLVLAMLGLIAKRREGQVIFAMEEPELSLPPHVQKRVVDKVRALASQALFTSHSPYVIEEFAPEQMMTLKRDLASGALSGAVVDLPTNIKPKAFREGVRIRFCEALLARRVVVVEGKTELNPYVSAARRAAQLDPASYERLDTLGWVLFDSVGQTNVAPFAAFFKTLGKIVATIFDKQDATSLAAITAACDVAFEQQYAGFEEMMTSEVPVAAQAAFVKKLSADGEWPTALTGNLPQAGADDWEYPSALLELLKSNKGADFVSSFFIQASLTEIPPTMLSALSKLRELAMPPAPSAGGEKPPNAIDNLF